MDCNDGNDDDGENLCLVSPSLSLLHVYLNDLSVCLSVCKEVRGQLCLFVCLSILSVTHIIASHCIGAE